MVYIHIDSYEEVKIKTHFFSKEFNFLSFLFVSLLAFGWLRFLLLIGYYYADQAGLEEHGKGIHSFL